ncbi:Nucleoside-transport system protein nupC [Serratia proteamaculans]|jgi:nucleoside permease NupC|nr:Nucleoside-transport system protein nupC [Serratia proteamaculans]CAI1042418.1 Nucleoside-transport system protein nupC [Serratia proteamaculans]
MGKLEFFNAVSALLLGQSENFIVYKGVLGKISENRIYTRAATAMSIQGLLDYLLYPFAWVLGVPAHEAQQVGSIMATKIVANECVATR